MLPAKAFPATSSSQPVANTASRLGQCCQLACSVARAVMEEGEAEFVRLNSSANVVVGGNMGLVEFTSV